MAEKKRKKKHRGLQYFFIKNKVWKELQSENKIDRIYKVKVKAIKLFSTLLRPFMSLQRVLFDKRLNKIDFKEQQPIFIIGHWRSGTTHLHYVFHKDEQFATLNSYQTFAFPTALLSLRVMKFILSPLMPAERTQDNIKMSVDKPGEEEQPLSVISKRTGIHSWIFPRNMSYFKKYNLFEGITAEEKKSWQKDYDFVLRNISFANKEKRLLLKNPHNTSRVKELLELYPNAKFVYIHRHPLDVYISMQHLFTKVIETQFLQYITRSERKEVIKYFYKTTMKKYLDERHLIPEGNLFEVAYDDFTGNELEYTEKIYKQLDIGGWEEAKPRIQYYLDSVKDYKRNKFRKISPELEAELREEYKFAFDAYGYE